MKAVGNYIVIDEIVQASKKTGGGLELTEKLKEDIRYRKGKIISSGPDALQKDQKILFDKVAGFPVEFEDNLYKVINIRDVIAII